MSRTIVSAEEVYSHVGAHCARLHTRKLLPALHPAQGVCTPTQIFEYNGAAIVAMAGKECVAIGSDLRLGVQFQTLATDHKKVFRIHDKLYIGLAGLSTDAQTLCALRLASAAKCTEWRVQFSCVQPHRPVAQAANHKRLL